LQELIIAVVKTKVQFAHIKAIAALT